MAYYLKFLKSLLLDTAQIITYGQLQIAPCGNFILQYQSISSASVSVIHILLLLYKVQNLPEVASGDDFKWSYSNSAKQTSTSTSPNIAFDIVNVCFLIQPVCAVVCLLCWHPCEPLNISHVIERLFCCRS